MTLPPETAVEKLRNCAQVLQGNVVFRGTRRTDTVEIAVEDYSRAMDLLTAALLQLDQAAAIAQLAAAVDQPILPSPYPLTMSGT